MTNKLISTIILTTLSFSCTTKPNKKDAYSLKDSVLVKHFAAIESTDDFDSTDLNYKVLKAYANNDTAFFKKLESDIAENERYNKQWQLIDSCIHQPKLQTLPVDEAYRFIYSAAFCPYKINVTVCREADTSNLHFILYQYVWDTTGCKIIKEFDKKLTTKEWEDITESLQIADFWGLKKENDYHGFDGDDITVIGYRRRKFHYVNRWLVARSTLNVSFNLILKLSGNKKGCLWIE